MALIGAGDVHGDGFVVQFATIHLELTDESDEQTPYQLFDVPAPSPLSSAGVGMNLLQLVEAPCTFVSHTSFALDITDYSFRPVDLRKWKPFPETIRTLAVLKITMFLQEKTSGPASHIGDHQLDPHDAQAVLALDAIERDPNAVLSLDDRYVAPGHRRGGRQLDATA